VTAQGTPYVRAYMWYFIILPTVMEEEVIPTAFTIVTAGTPHMRLYVAFCGLFITSPTTMEEEVIPLRSHHGLQQGTLHVRAYMWYFLWFIYYLIQPME
jgi:hypothetical protein